MTALAMPSVSGFSSARDNSLAGVSMFICLAYNIRLSNGTLLMKIININQLAIVMIVTVHLQLGVM